MQHQPPTAMHQSPKPSAAKSSPRRRRWLIWLAALGLIWLLATVGSIWMGLRQLRAAQAHLSAPLSAASVSAACDASTSAQAALTWTRRLTLPVAPLLRQLGWVPKVGPALSALPSLSDSAVHGGALAAEGCTLLAPALGALDQPAEARLGALVAALQGHEPDWAGLDARLAELGAAWQGIPAPAFAAWPLSSYPQTANGARLIADLRSALTTAQRIWPAAASLIGSDTPKSYLIVAQNPFELRPSGGFIGTVATITVTAGRISPPLWLNSSELDAVAPPGSAMPQPYADYLRASQWTLRDANWWPDWPTSARTLATFWQANGKPPLDGVISVDLYALEALLAALGSVDVPGYGSVAAADGLASVYQTYERPGVGGNKDFIGALMQAVVARMQHPAPHEAPALLAQLGASLDRRHIQLWLTDGTAQATVAAAGWGGVLPPPTSDELLVVEADLSYSDSQMFLEHNQELRLDFDASGQVQTATLTLTYTNRYDPWLAESTPHQVFGYCYDPATGRQERIPGCYGAYVRAYLAPTAAPLALEGADSGMQLSRENGRSVVGMYLYLVPGETRRVTLSYLPQVQGPYELVLRKQAGVATREVIVTSATAPGPTLQSSYEALERDVTLSLADGMLIGEPLTSTLPLLWREQAAWERGYVAWQAGEGAEALRIWQADGVLERGLDQAWALFWRGDGAGAQTLALAIQNQSPTARGALLLGWLAEEAGDSDQAQEHYRAATEHDPTHPTAWMALALLAEAEGRPEEAQAALAKVPNATERLRAEAFDLRFQQRYAEADRINRLLLALLPGDAAALEERYWLARFAAEPDWERARAIATDALSFEPAAALWLDRRAEAAYQLGERDAALADWRHVTELAPDNAMAWYYQALIHLERGATAEAIAALEAMERTPQPISEGRIMLGRLYRDQGDTEAARAIWAAVLAKEPEREDLRRELEALP